MENNNSIQALNWRYATKSFDQNKKLTQDQVNLVIESLRLSPSSFGLQGWKFVRVVDNNLREQLKEAAYGQSQVTEASELFVLAVPTNFGMKHVDKYITSTAEIRNIKLEDLAGFREMMNGFLSAKDSNQILEWLKRQVYIALGTAITVCAINNIDTCPMEGFDTNRFDEILGFKDLNLTSVLMMPVGYRSNSDRNAEVSKSRFSKEEVFLER